MRKELIFATGNSNKVSEIQSILGDSFHIKSLKDIAQEHHKDMIELKEPYNTLEANAKTKAEQLKRLSGQDCFAEDSGLFVGALNGEPGVYSARYSGASATDQSNLEFLLKKLGDNEDKTAYFKTVIHLIHNGRHHHFTGICDGVIIDTPTGDQGFGYDPHFVPNEIPTKTFAQLTKEEKNTISHRGKATRDFVEWLKEN